MSDKISGKCPTCSSPIVSLVDPPEPQSEPQLPLGEQVEKTDHLTFANNTLADIDGTVTYQAYRSLAPSGYRLSGLTADRLHEYASVLYQGGGRPQSQINPQVVIIDDPLNTVTQLNIDIDLDDEDGDEL